MAYTQFANLIAVLTSLLAVAAADEIQQPPEKVPVQLSGRLMTTEPDARKRVEFVLTIGDEFEIYSERKHQFLPPLMVVLLDAEYQTIKSEVVYPKPRKIPFDKELGGDFYVYHGKATFAATCAPDAKPSYVRVVYHGYSKRGY
jgi:hypothetical protein